MHRMFPGLVVLMSAAVQAQVRPAVVKEFGWHASYPSATAEARRTGKPMLLVFRCDP